MKMALVQKWYSGIVGIIVLGMVLHAPLTVWLGSVWPEYALGFKAWKELLMLVLLALAAYEITRRKMWRELFRDNLIHLVVAYGALHLAMSLLGQGAFVAVSGLMIDLRYVLFLVLVYVGVRLWPSLGRGVLKWAAIGAVIVVGFACMQLFLPRDMLASIGYGPDTIAPYGTIDKNDDFVRQNSTLRGPNPLGAYAAAVLAVSAAVVARPRGWRERALYVAGGAMLFVALYVSHSRSAYIAAIVGLAVVIFLRLRPVWRVRAAAAGTLLLGLSVAAVIAFADTPFVSNTVFHTDPSEASSIDSDDQRLSSLSAGLEQMVNEPFGAGVGSTGSASLQGDSPLIIENQYLMIAHEVGWLGLAIFAALYGLILYRLWLARKSPLALGLLASGLGLAAIGLVLPVWADDTVSILWWGLAGAVLAIPAQNSRTETS